MLEIIICVLLFFMGLSLLVVAVDFVMLVMSVLRKVLVEYLRGTLDQTLMYNTNGMLFVQKEEIVKYLKSELVSKIYPYKVCIITGSQKKLRALLTSQDRPYRIGKEKRCGWIGFLYCRDRAEALELRECFYTRKDMYVLLQDDRSILSYYKAK